MKRRFIGIDLHKKSFTIAIKDEEGKISIITMELLPKNVEKLQTMLKKTDYVAIEVSGPTFYFYDQIKDYVEISNSIIFDNCIISENIKLNNCIIGKNSSLNCKGVPIDNCVVVGNVKDKEELYKIMYKFN